MSVVHADSISKAINDLEIFFLSDMWFAKAHEWKCEKDMINYLNSHFEVLRKEIILGIGKKEFIKKFREEKK